MDRRKVSLLVRTLENVIESLKLELGEEEEQQPQNSIKLTDLIEKPLPDDDMDYYEEDTGPDVLLNSKEEQEFYSKFKLGE
jgi:hypothetical protein